MNQSQVAPVAPKTCTQVYNRIIVVSDQPAATLAGRTMLTTSFSIGVGLIAVGLARMYGQKYLDKQKAAFDARLQNALKAFAL